MKAVLEAYVFVVKGLNLTVIVELSLVVVVDRGLTDTIGPFKISPRLNVVR